MSGTKEDHIKYRIEISKELFDDAKLLAANKSWFSCVNRLFYSSFNLLIALLLKNNLETKTHKGMRIQFNEYFVKTGFFSDEEGKLYSKLYDWRQAGDYSAFISFDEKMILPVIQEVGAFNNKILELLNKE